MAPPPSGQESAHPQPDGSLSSTDLLSQLPSVDAWQAGHKSERTRRAYRQDAVDFIASLRLQTPKELYQASPANVLAWKLHLEQRGVKPSTVRRKLSALSSLFTHLVRHRIAVFNPVQGVERPSIGRTSMRIAAFSPEQARIILNAPPRHTLLGLRDRAILSVGMQIGARRSEIAQLTVSDLCQHNGFWCLRIARKARGQALEALNLETRDRITDYLGRARHGADFDGPMFRPTRSNQVKGTHDLRRHLAPNAIDRVLKKWCAKSLGSADGFSSHSMRATFAATALANGAKLENVQKALGHANPSTTMLYADHRDGYPGDAAAFRVNFRTELSGSRGDDQA